MRSAIYIDSNQLTPNATQYAVNTLCWVLNKLWRHPFLPTLNHGPCDLSPVWCALGRGGGHLSGCLIYMM